MLPAISLLSLACAIANSGQIDMSGAEAQLTNSEKVQIQQYINQGSCLPKSMELLLQETKFDVENGKLNNFDSKILHQPTELCTK